MTQEASRQTHQTCNGSDGWLRNNKLFQRVCVAEGPDGGIFSNKWNAASDETAGKSCIPSIVMKKLRTAAPPSIPPRTSIGCASIAAHHTSTVFGIVIAKCAYEYLPMLEAQCINYLAKGSSVHFGLKGLCSVRGRDYAHSVHAQVEACEGNEGYPTGCHHIQCSSCLCRYQAPLQAEIYHIVIQQARVKRVR